MSSQDLNFKVKKTSEKISENIHIVSNDPSLAFYRIQEHVRKVLPAILDKRNEVMLLQDNLQGHCYDMEYAVSAVKGIDHSITVFKNIHEMVKISLFIRQQLKYEERRDVTPSSVYKRFSAHLTLDLPELPDFTGVVRETGYRMESVMAPMRGDSSIQSSIGELQRSHTTLH